MSTPGLNRVPRYQVSGYKNPLWRTKKGLIGEEVVRSTQQDSTENGSLKRFSIRHRIQLKGVTETVALSWGRTSHFRTRGEDVQGANTKETYRRLRRTSPNPLLGRILSSLEPRKRRVVQLLLLSGPSVTPSTLPPPPSTGLFGPEEGVSSSDTVSSPATSSLFLWTLTYNPTKTKHTLVRKLHSLTQD